MSDTPKTTSPELLKCPLCEGRGELPKQQLLDRLSEKDLARKVENYMSIVEADAKESLHGLSTDQTPNNVTAWNLTHFLWRRSPKE